MREGTRERRCGWRAGGSLLHLSDIHFRERTAWDADPVLRALTRFVGEEVERDGTPDLVAITGDLAFAGIEVEYDLART